MTLECGTLLPLYRSSSTSKISHEEVTSEDSSSQQQDGSVTGQDRVRDEQHQHLCDRSCRAEIPVYGARHKRHIDEMGDTITNTQISAG